MSFRRSWPDNPEVEYSKPPEPTPFRPRHTDLHICTFDTETDPFLKGRVPKPFSCGFYDGQDYWDFWGEDCIDQFFRFLVSYGRKYPKRKLLIYAHNGGNFDFHFMLDYLDANTRPKIIDGRLTKLTMGGHEFRDSVKILPIRLGDYQKDEIEYWKMERIFRDQYRAEILSYMRTDCVALHELVMRFHTEYGDHLTIGGMALKMLRSLHGFDCMSPAADELIRPWFFGGRTQCFEVGRLIPRNGLWRVYDVNSMYPFAMANFDHPVSGVPIVQATMNEQSDFIQLDAWNDGCLPMREADGALNFTTKYGTFYATRHEIEAGIETGTLKIDRIRKAYRFEHKARFDRYVEHFNDKKVSSKEAGDKAGYLLGKLGSNNGYGKLAQDSRKYEDFFMGMGEEPHGPAWAEEELHRDDGTLIAGPKGWRSDLVTNTFTLYRRPARNAGVSFYNVAAAASITGASRATLLRALSKATRPVYCDTDSIGCEELNGVELHPTKLGAWDLECTGDTFCIAGKKMYAIFNAGETIKKASKGVKLTAEQIADVCDGKTVEYEHEVPKFKLDGKHKWTKRKIARTFSSFEPVIIGEGIDDEPEF